MAEWNYLQDLLPSLKNGLKSRNLELSTMPQLVPRVARLQHDLGEPQKEIGKRSAKLAWLK